MACQASNNDNSMTIHRNKRRLYENKKIQTNNKIVKYVYGTLYTLIYFLNCTAGSQNPKEYKKPRTTTPASTSTLPYEWPACCV